MKITIIIGWTFSLLSLITMFIGHLGKHDFNWISHQISTFAAKGPNDTWSLLFLKRPRSQ